jgi:hypothetical protein
MNATSRHFIGMSGVFCAFAASASCSHAVKPDSMSAEQHRQEANKEMTQAQTEVTRASLDAPPPPNLAVSNGNPAGYYYPIDAYNPAGEHLVRARALEEHARQHRDAATKLEAFAKDECGGFPPETRAACPMLGPVSQIADVPMGVKVWFTPKTRVDAVAAHMRCHLAYAKVYGFDTVQECPLYVRGLQINVSADGKAIELTSHEPRTVDVIRVRTREEAVLVRQ